MGLFVRKEKETIASQQERINTLEQQIALYNFNIDQGPWFHDGSVLINGVECRIYKAHSDNPTINLRFAVKPGERFP